MRPSFLNERKSENFAGSLNIRTKLCLCLLASLTSLFLSNPYALLVLTFASTMYALTALSPVALGRIYCFVMLSYCISLSFSSILSLIMPDLIKWEFMRFAIPFLRMAISINALFALGYSSRIQDVLAELKIFGRFVWIQVPLSVAIRFIPTFIDDCGQIFDAWRLRKPLKGSGVKASVSSMWRGFLVPLTFRLFRSADDLSVAAELKGIGKNKDRTACKLWGNKPEVGDIIVLSSAALSIGIAIAIQIIYGAFKVMGH